MRNLLMTIAVTLGLSLVAASAVRADEHTRDHNSPLRGTFCSAAAADGNWGFVFSPSTIMYNCAQLRNALAFRTNAPLVGINRGYYWLNAGNVVTVRCYGGWRYFTGLGYVPLQLAYNYAASYGANSCLFYVN